MLDNNMAILYEIVNNITNQKYIGVTTTSLKSRWGVHLYKLRHGKAPSKFQQAFDEYGENNFSIVKIKEGKLDDMCILEKQLTKETVINGYNTIIGGWDSEERSSASFVFQKKLNENEEYAKDFYKRVGDGNRGKKVSEEAKIKMSLKKKGIKWEQYKKDNRSIQYSGSGNPNFNNYAIFLNTSTGIYYNTLEMAEYFGLTKYGFKGMLSRKDNRLSNFIKT